MFLFHCVSLSLSLYLSSCLGCIPPLIGLPFLRSLLKSVLCGCLLFVFFCLYFCLCLCLWFMLVYFIFVFPVSLPGNDAFCWLLSCPLLSSVCFSCFFFSFLFSSETVPGLIWFGSVYLVTTTGFVADPFMWDTQQQTNKNSILLSTPRANFVSTKCFEDPESTSI